MFKHTTDAQIVILDDGCAEHLNQSQAAADALNRKLEVEGKHVRAETVTLDFRPSVIKKRFEMFVALARVLPFLRSENYLRYFLTDACYGALMNIKSDFVISCGTAIEGVNYILSKSHQAKSMVLDPR